MQQSSLLGNVVLKKRQQFKAILYQDPGNLKEIEDEVGLKREEHTDTPVIHEDGSIEVTNGGYYLPQFIGDTRCEPEYMRVKPGEVMIFPLHSSKNAFVISKEEFDNLYEVI